ncbi:MAG: glycosyltransferase family 9 protein, partial [Candidatus Aureabacteria bacterium]|nr:glycosyltransferase family 9 protein [Candidatus Auribacterota bacterium]
MDMEKLKHDCRYMRWDRPCSPHKIDGVHCRACTYYDKIDGRLLVIKLDALGDVLRTTCILSPLREKFPRAHVTWITMTAALPLLENIPHIDHVVAYGPDALAMLAVQRFDIVFCLDASQRSATLGSMAKARERVGFGIDRTGRVFPYNAEGNEWFMMGLFDDIKKKNTRTYQDMATGICGLSGLRQEICARLTDEEQAFAARFAAGAGLRLAGKGSRARKVIGVNTGSGSRWPMKQWPVARTVEFIRALLRRKNLRVLLFGGEEERERNRQIMEAAGAGVIDTGCQNSLREFMALVSLCDILVTSDTLGLHVALGLGKKVVALFGPTSATEIDVYGRGIKIAADVECACCYLRTCARTPSCMAEIR